MALEESRQQVRQTQGGPLIVGLMGITVVFALVGSEIAALEKPNASTAGHLVQQGTGAAKVLVGGTLATTALVLLAHGGDAGRQFATGLALVSMVTATLVYGGPVWAAISRSVGAPAGAPGTGSTTPTGNTTPATNTTASVGTLALTLGGFA